MPPTVLVLEETCKHRDPGVQASSIQLAASLMSASKEVDHPPVSMGSPKAKPVGVMGACAHGNPALKKNCCQSMPNHEALMDGSFGIVP
jgi:hypothetical protein